MPGNKRPAARLSQEDFERLAEKAFDDIPEEFRRKLHNVELAVQAMPGKEAGRWRGSRTLMGLYVGLTREEMLALDAGPCLPARIVLYQRNIESACRTPEEVDSEVRATLRHEIAHHFGFEEEELDELWPMV